MNDVEPTLQKSGHFNNNSLPLHNTLTQSYSPFHCTKIMPDTPNMSATTKELLKKVRMIVPPMLEKFHKGQLGRVAVIGGSEKYVEFVCAFHVEWTRAF